VKKNAEFADDKLQLQVKSKPDALTESTSVERAQPHGSMDRLTNEGGRFFIRATPVDRSREWTVVAVQIPRYPHSAALQELVEAVYYGLKQLDQQVTLTNGHREFSNNTVIIGGHLLSPEQCAKVPNGAVVYNSEHADSHWFNKHYVALLQRTIVWDYSADNTKWLADKLGRPVLHVPLGYVPQFTRINSRRTNDEDLDVLFFGAPNARRERIFDEIRSRGLLFHHAFGVYGSERDALVERSKVVINIHQYTRGALEILRIAYLLSNKKAIVTEINPGETIDPDLEGAFVAAPYESMASSAADLVANPLARATLATTGFRKFICRSEAVILRDALAGRLDDKSTTLIE
jgi:hypothetical protein